MFRERGGSSSFARHAFNELIAFIAGWAILIDYLIVDRPGGDLGARTTWSRSRPTSPRPGWEIGVAARGDRRRLRAQRLQRHRPRPRAAARGPRPRRPRPAAGGDRRRRARRPAPRPPHRPAPPLHRPELQATSSTPRWWRCSPTPGSRPPPTSPRTSTSTARDLKRIVSLGAVAVPLVYAGMAAIALMAVPVVAGPHGPETALGSEFVEEPVLGVVSAYHPHWVADAMRWMVGAGRRAGPLLGRRRPRCSASPATSTRWRSTARSPAGSASSSSRHATPHVAIAICGVIAIGLVIPTNVKLLAGIYAFGATLAITIAHLSIIRLRVTEPDRPRPFRIPLGMSPGGGAELPLPAIFAARRSAASPSSASSPTTTPPAGSAAAGWPSACSSTSSTARSSRGRR